ncbi:hypothetical protein JCM10213_008175 [Rhodosporidiobolus nylandii]
MCTSDAPALTRSRALEFESRRPIASFPPIFPAPRVDPLRYYRSDLGPGDCGSLKLSASDTDFRLGEIELNGVFAAHLLSIFETTPQAWIPLLSRPNSPLVRQSFEEAGRRLEALSPELEVLATAMLATAARALDHPFLIGAPPAQAPPSSASHGSPISPVSAAPATDQSAQSLDRPLAPVIAPDGDLREFGQRREDACRAIKAHALKLAQKRGVTITTSDANAISCYLLDHLERHTPTFSGQPFRAAFVNHVRVLASQTDTSVRTRWEWTVMALREALVAVGDGTVCYFNNSDDLLLNETVPLPLPELLSVMKEKETAFRQAVAYNVQLEPELVQRQFEVATNSVVFHLTRLARECIEKITSPPARRFPLDLTFLLSLPSRLETAERSLRGLAALSSSVLALPPASINKVSRVLCRVTLLTSQVSYPSLILPVYLALRSHPLLPSTPLPPFVLLDLERRSLASVRRLAMWLAEAPSLTWKTHVALVVKDEWISVLSEAPTVEEGGRGITMEEKKRELGWVIRGLKEYGWSWQSDDNLISSLENRLAELSLPIAYPAHPSFPTFPSFRDVGYAEGGPSSYAQVWVIQQ